MVFLDRNIAYMLLHILLLKEGVHSVCPLKEEENIGSLCMNFFRFCLSFPFTELVIYPSAVINLSCESNYSEG